MARIPEPGKPEPDAVAKGGFHSFVAGNARDRAIAVEGDHARRRIGEIAGNALDRQTHALGSKIAGDQAVDAQIRGPVV
ncbi:hypothetical protein D3C87_1954020 [compost metagenome]